MHAVSKVAGMLYAAGKPLLTWANSLGTELKEFSITGLYAIFATSNVFKLRYSTTRSWSSLPSGRIIQSRLSSSLFL
jgi:hypothetical protein